MTPVVLYDSYKIDRYLFAHKTTYIYKAYENIKYKGLGTFGNPVGLLRKAPIFQ